MFAGGRIASSRLRAGARARRRDSRLCGGEPDGCAEGHGESVLVQEQAQTPADAWTFQLFGAADRRGRAGGHVFLRRSRADGYTGEKWPARTGNAKESAV